MASRVGRDRLYRRPSVNGVTQPHRAVPIDAPSAVAQDSRTRPGSTCRSAGGGPSSPDRPAVISLLVPTALTMSAIYIWLVDLSRVNLDSVSNIGLITAVGPLFFVALAFLTVGFCTTLLLTPNRPLLVAQSVVLVMILYGTPALVEPLARFSTAWLHAGFADYIASTGRTIPSLDARFNWPGFFGLAALATRATGLGSAVAFLQWAPIFLLGLYVVAVYSIASIATQTNEVRWLAVWLFVAADWVGQDYFSPQGLAYFLYLATMLTVLAFFCLGGPSVVSIPVPSTSRLTAWLGRISPEEGKGQAANARTRALLVAVLLAIYAVIVLSHQLTPLAVIAGVGALVIVGRCRLRSLPIVLTVGLASWVAYGATAYWTGHLSNLFGSAGHVGESVSENLGQRVRGNASRLFVLDIRLGFTLAVVLVASVGYIRRLQAHRGDLSFAVLAVSPFPVLIAQTYGGEALLRAYFFALPFLALFAAFAIVPAGGFNRKSAMIAFCALMVMFPLFFLSRYGNERFDMVTREEHAGIEWLLDHAPPGSRLIPLASEVPWGYRKLDQFDNYPTNERQVLADPAKAARLLDTGPPEGSYLLMTRGQEAFGELTQDLPPHWASDMASTLLRTGRYRVAYRNGDALILTRLSDRSEG